MEKGEQTYAPLKTVKTLFRFFRHFPEEFTPKSFHCLKQGYTLTMLRRDLVAGTTVGVVAVPLAMAFAIASGVTPAAGLFTAIVAGFLIALLGEAVFKLQDLRAPLLRLFTTSSHGKGMKDSSLPH